MPRKRDDAACLWDMLHAAEAIARLTTSISFDQYVANEDLRASVERRIEIIGEAARRVSQACRDAHPEIPWRSIIAQRHILAHEYDDIDDQLLWRVASVHVPELIAKLRPIVPDPPSAP